MAPARLIRLLAAATLLAEVATASAAPELVWHPFDEAGREGELRVEGLPPARLARVGSQDDRIAAELGQRLLRVVAAPSGSAPDPALPNLWGEYRIAESALVFQPRHALGAGVTLHARFDGSAFDDATGGAGTPSSELRVPIAPLDAPGPVVVSVAPSGDELPENLLRLYVEFSAPMSLRDVERQVALVDADGEEIAGAFVPTPGGLWDPERRRLTLLLDPGRVKRGLQAHDRLGPPLRAGEAVRLVVRRGALDVDGRPLARPFERPFRVVPARRTPLDLTAWVLEPPRAADAPLTIDFGRPLDRALASRALAVVDDRGAPVAGLLALAPGEKSAAFRPERPWRPGVRYRLVADPALEDPCGNRLGRPFERALADSRPPAIALWREFVPEFPAPKI